MTQAGTSLTLKISSEFNSTFVGLFRDHIAILCSQSEESEEIIGEWMEERGIRDQIFLATKVNFLAESMNIVFTLIFLKVYSALQES